MRIVNEDGSDVAQGEVGEIVARGPRIMKGYWDEEGATRDAIRGDWLYTGDLGYQDGDGYIYLSGRAEGHYQAGRGDGFPRRGGAGDHVPSGG